MTAPLSKVVKRASRDYDNSWVDALECGHVVVAKRSAGKPKRRRCRECAPLDTLGVEGSAPRRLADLMQRLGFQLDKVYDDSPSRIRAVFTSEPAHGVTLYTTITYEDTMERPT